MKTISAQQLKEFLAQPGINVKGICTEAGITEPALYRRLKETKLPGPKCMAKLEPVLRKYGFYEIFKNTRDLLKSS